MGVKIIALVLVAFGMSYLAIPALVALSSKYNITDSISKRKRHKQDISMLGGVSIFAVLLITYAVLTNSGNFLLYAYSLASFTLLFIVGLYDDIRPLNASKKFFFQISSAIILVYLAEVHHSDYFTQLSISEDLVKVISVVFIVFIINSYNLIDGINGLSALLSMVPLLGFGIWFFLAGFPDNAAVCFALSASIVAFLRYNLFNTRIFLGDNGSMLLGLVTAYYSIVFVQCNQGLGDSSEFKLVAPFGVAVAALAIPALDTLRLFVMRSLYLKKSPFKPDRNHLHHLLLRLGFSHIQISFVLTIIGALLLIFAFSAQAIGNTGIVFIIVLVFVTLLVALDYFIFNFYRQALHKKTVFNEMLRIRSELDNPVIYEFFFALSFFILAVAIPFHRVSASIPTILVLVSFIILLLRNWIRYKHKFRSVFGNEALRFFKHPYSVLTILFVSIYIAQYAFNPTGKFNALSLKLLLVFYWVPFFELRKVINIRPVFLIKAYVYGCFGFSIFIIYHALFSFHLLGWDTFFYSNLLSHVKANPITHSLFYNLAVVFTILSFKTVKTQLWRGVYLVIFATFIVMIALISSKMGYLVLVANLLASIVYLVRKTSYKLVVITFLFGTIMVGYFFVPNLSNRIDGFMWRIKPHDKISMDNRLPRPIIWQESIRLIKENWISGIGVGNSMSELGERYEAINYAKGAKYKFNSHNQLLESFLETGVIGFLTLIAIFIYCVKVALKQRSLIYALFLLNILFYAMIESLFETQTGMVAFAFFNALFLSSFIKDHDANRAQ